MSGNSLTGKNTPAQRIHKRISVLEQEQDLLQKRLSVFNSTNNPKSITRGQQYRETSIDSIRNRLVEIASELTIEENKLKNYNSTALNLTRVESIESQKPKNFGGLERFLKLSLKNNTKMVPRSPPPTTKVTAVVINTSTEPIIVTTTAPTPTKGDEPEAMGVDTTGIYKTMPSATAPENTTSTPFRKGATFNPLMGQFNFPPFYEDPIDRAARLQKEEKLRNEFNEKFNFNPNTGAKPKKSVDFENIFTQRRSPQPYNMDEDEPILNTFATYKPTPVRLAKSVLTKNNEIEDQNLSQDVQTDMQHIQSIPKGAIYPKLTRLAGESSQPKHTGSSKRIVQPIHTGLSNRRK